MYARKVSLCSKLESVGQFLQKIEHQMVLLFRKQEGVLDQLILLSGSGETIYVYSFWDNSEDAEKYDSTTLPKLTRLLTGVIHGRCVFTPSEVRVGACLVVHVKCYVSWSSTKPNQGGRMEEGIIHIQWQGPYSLRQLDILKDPRKDRGLYQIYGHHPVYGANVLLFIGQTMGETFGERIEEHNFGGGFQEDREHVEIYVGRLKGVSTPSLNEWRNEINWAEKLLIHVHDPAYNPRHNMELDEADPRVCNARVLNWGCIRALQPEVSGRRWTKAKTDEANGYKVYETPDQCAAVPAPASGVQGS